jgi:hypothetical protein
MAWTKEELLAYRERMERYNAWEAAHPVVMTPQEAIAAVSALYELLPAEARQPAAFEESRSVYARLDTANRRD